MNAIEWIDEERRLLWSWFVEASRSAIRKPDPLSPRSWSIRMVSLAERIREADEILGGPTPWREIEGNAFPYYLLVENAALPKDAWAWLRDYVQANPDASARWALDYQEFVA